MKELSGKNIWEIEEHYFCPIVGYCLTLEEQKKIYKKFTKGTDAAKKKLNGINLHEFLVMGISSPIPLAKAVQNILNSKYAVLIERYSSFEYADWRRETKKILNPDNYGAFIWISAAYMKFTKIQSAQIYGLIHMYSHDILTDLKKANSKVDLLENQYDELYDLNQNLKVKWKKKEGELSNLKVNYNNLERQNKELEQRFFTLKGDKSDVLLLKRSTEVLISKLQEEKNLNAALQYENNVLRKNETKLNRKVNQLLEGFDKMLFDLNDENDCCKECDKIDLCSKRVLIVGGIVRMKGFYKELIETLGGRFAYHNGVCQNSGKGLQSQVSQADVVICPIDINSHRACLEVKKFCKKSNKEYRMIRKSSVSSVYTALLEFAGN